MEGGKKDECKEDRIHNEGDMNREHEEEDPYRR